MIHDHLLTVVSWISEVHSFWDNVVRSAEGSLSCAQGVLAAALQTVPKATWTSRCGDWLVYVPAAGFAPVRISEAVGRDMKLFT